jgi:phosphate transport system permease protein
MNLKKRLLTDIWGKKLMLGLTIFCVSTALFIGLGLFYKSAPLMQSQHLSELLFSTEWSPSQGKFGLWGFILGTLWVTFTALLIAFLPCLLCSIYLTEYADKRIMNTVRPVIDVLAGIPSVIFGVWGIILVVPFVSDYVAPLFGVQSTGYTILAGGIVLALSVFPVIIQLLVELFQSIPRELREASLSLGATQWQTIKWVMLRKAGPGVVSAVVIAFCRAFGETMSVIMVTGNVVMVPHSVLDPAYPLPSLIANNYGEMLSIPLYDSALMFVALILFSIILIFNLISRYILLQVEKSGV